MGYLTVRQAFRLPHTQSTAGAGWARACVRPASRMHSSYPSSLQHVH